MNREALARILNRTRDGEGVALVDRPTNAVFDIPIHTSPPWTRLWSLLDTWAGIDERAWSEANVKALYDDIMDVFQENPGKATHIGHGLSPSFLILSPL